MRFAAGALLLACVLSTPAAAQCVVASTYDEGRLTANGEHFHPDGMTAAHRTLPFGTRVRVTSCGNSHGPRKSVVVRINDRGPFIRGRAIDLARGAARALGFSGLMRVEIQRL